MKALPDHCRFHLAFLALAFAFGGPAHAASPRGVAYVHVFQSGEAGIFANAYLVETEHSVVVVDSTLLESTSKALRARLQEIGKPLRAVLITHGHPDHYNGVTNLCAGEKVDVYATPETDRVIRESDAAKEKQWAPVFGAEWPVHRTFPNRILPTGGTFSVDDVTFTVRALGPGESHADSYWIMEGNTGRAAFIGDEVLNHVHAYVSDGHVSAWLRNLTVLEHDLAGVGRIYPGHGDMGGLEIVRWQRDYLRFYRQTVSALVGGQKEITEAQKAQLVAAMEGFLPNKRLEFLIGLGAGPVGAELAAERP